MDLEVSGKFVYTAVSATNYTITRFVFCVDILTRLFWKIILTHGGETYRRKNTNS